MHYCNRCSSTIPNHLPDEKICSRCVAEDELKAENKRLREILCDNLLIEGDEVAVLRAENKYLRRLLKEAHESPQGVVGDLADRIEEILAGGGGE